jgi:NAD-dependent SIR2 family protein deacetylase
MGVTNTLTTPRSIKRAYFLGAGASKAFCPSFPLARDLTIGSLLDSSNYKDFEAPTTAMQRIHDYLLRTKKSSEVLALPIEEVLDSLIPGLEPEYPYENISYCLFYRFHMPTSDYPRELVEWLKKVRLEKSAIITTNYDTLIEWVLANTGTGEFIPGDLIDRDALHWLDFGLPLDHVNPRKDSARWATPPERSVPYLKLHGSISWTYCEDCKKYSLGEIYERAAENALAGADRCPNCDGGKRVHPVIVPMSLRKEISDFGIKCIWERAQSILSSVVEIVFGGFSLSPADSHIRDLLCRGHELAKTSNVTVVDPSTESIERYRAIYGKAVLPVSKGWQNYLADL